jgi:HPt (histidine-containing phosphotransfer) domain-containing protein
MSMESVPHQNPSPLSAETSANTLDPAALRALRGLVGAGGIERIARCFLDTTSQLLQDMRRALNSGDAESAGRIAHSLHSASASIGALDLSRQCKELELAVRMSEYAGIETRLNAAELEYKGVQLALHLEMERSG